MVRDAFPDPLVFSGLNTIDISPSDTSILQHLYYGNNRTILDDIEQTVRLFIPIGDRLQPRMEGTYWVLKSRGARWNPSTILPLIQVLRLTARPARV
jgi:hypothetical protein